MQANWETQNSQKSVCATRTTYSQQYHLGTPQLFSLTFSMSLSRSLSQFPSLQNKVNDGSALKSLMWALNLLTWETYLSSYLPVPGSQTSPIDTTAKCMFVCPFSLLSLPLLTQEERWQIDTVENEIKDGAAAPTQLKPFSALQVHFESLVWSPVNFVLFSFDLYRLWNQVSFFFPSVFHLELVYTCKHQTPASKTP